MRETVEAALREIGPKAEAKGVSLDLDVPGLPPVMVDPIRFNQILKKLLANAVKFNSSGGRVTVTVRHVPGTPDAGEAIEIAVTDTGIGIKPEDLPMLFQTFTQLDPTLAKRYQGAGLGLSLTKRLVELHGGRIWAESPGQEQGSTFRVRLPLKR
jgi:signal transduction histidine kinase